ncbi:MAG: hypothetical protein QOJ97_2411, partial [Solirubrobacteraceae bacterium]|nr:hypothetical protein [Solirubrobacteraceae bacterium]
MPRRRAMVLLVCLAAVVAPTASVAASLVSPSPTERAWRHRVAEGFGGTPRVSAARAATVEQLLRHAVAASGGQIVRLVVRRGPQLAPELVIRTSEPAGYLKHALRQVLRRMPARSVYLAVVDGQGRRVLEWALNSGPGQRQGSLYVRRDL